MHTHGIEFYPDTLPGETTVNPTERSGLWRERQPTPVLIDQPFVATSENIVAGESMIEPVDAPRLIEQLEPLRQKVFASIQSGFEASFEQADGDPASVIVWDGTKINVEEHQGIAVFNPVYMGSLGPKVIEAFSAPTIEKFREGIRYATPEVKWPLSFSIGREMGLGLADPNFINVIFIQDNERLIDNLPADRRVALSRSLFAGFGSWKADFVTYSVDETGQASLNNVTLATLEGGHPAFGEQDLDELGWRHKVLASTVKVEVDKIPAAKEPPIKHDDWTHSPTVEGIRASGRELGKRGLLSDSVIVGELVSDERLGKLVGRISGASQQGEGALFAWDPALDKLIVSCTGQMGAMKANLQINEVVAIVPITDTQIGMVSVEGLGDPLKPSVEGPEFGYPMWELLSEHPIAIKEVDEGYELSNADAEGAKIVPPIRGGGHLHRGNIPVPSQSVRHLEIVAEDWPPVGCGVDAANEFSHYIFREAVKAWEESGRQLEFVTYPVPGHSINYLQFYVSGKANHKDHSKALVEALDEGRLIFTPDVEQVSQRIKPRAGNTRLGLDQMASGGDGA